MEPSGKSDNFGTSGMYIVDPKYEKKTHPKCPKCWCVLLVVLLVVAVIAGAIFGILKAIQSSESSEKNKQEENSCYSMKCTSTAVFVMTKASSQPGTTSAVPTIASSSMENISPSRTSQPGTTSVVPTIVTSWSTWQAWSGCSTSCGGGIQTRNRTCGKPNIPNVIPNCYGDNVLYRNCSTWKCPDCSKPCPTGHLNSACDACVCTNVTVTGMVKNEEGTLLNNATIALSEFPFNVLARTNVAGHFEMRGICVDQEEMIVERSGYIPQLLKPQKIDSTSFTISARLEAIVFPEVTVHPESKIRIENHTMTFCCAGTAKPPPKYEWIMNGRSVGEYQQDEDGSSKLIIPRLHRNMTGEVKCRVYNDYGAEFSNVAEITVISKNDSCNDKPLSQTTTLPSGCVDKETNSSVVDVGRCADDICFANHLTSPNCVDNYCCQSVAEKDIVILCQGGAAFNITRVTSCGCGRCSPKITTVTGIATGGPNNIPFKYGFIYNAGKYLTQTGRNGEFSFTMTGQITRVVLNFKGKDRYNDFQDLTKVVPVVPGRETFVEVRLKPRPEPMLVNASETIEIPMGNDRQSSSAPVVLSLPPQSLITENGEVYNGTANVEVSFSDPRNASQVQEADGDFTAISEDGDQQLLDTFGVLKVDFTDSKGKPLQTKEDVEVLLDLDEYNITEKEAEDIKLWYMDETTGRWRIMDSGLKQHESRRSKRSGRKFYFGKIDHTEYRRLANLDKIRGSDACYVKIKVNDGAVDSQSVKITVTSTQGNLNRYYDYSMRTGTSRCIRTFCRRLTIQATKNRDVLLPNDENISVDLKREHGIVYHRFENASHRFNNRITIQDISNPTTTGGPFSQFSCTGSYNNSLVFDVQEPSTGNTGNSILSQGPKWHNNPEFNVCYVKINTVQNSCDNEISFYVKSTNVTKSPHFQEGRTITSTSSGSICAEFRCPLLGTRGMLVTITALVEGDFSVTEPFKTEHERDGHSVFVGKVIGFRPIPALNKHSIGISYRASNRDVSLRADFHQDSKSFCEAMEAGVEFTCA